VQYFYGQQQCMWTTQKINDIMWTTQNILDITKDFLLYPPQYTKSATNRNLFKLLCLM